MKKKLHIMFILGLSIPLASCDKDTKDINLSASNEIILIVKDPLAEAQAQTKTTALSTLPSSLYLAGTTGSGTTQSEKWSPESMSVSSSKISTGYYQTATATAYNYYLSNLAMTFSASGYTIVADGSTTDAIAGIASAETSVTPSVTMDHIFARTGSISISSTNGYTLSDVTYQLASKGENTGTKGTYNICTKAWSGTTALASQSITTSSDLYLIPGKYTLTVSGTETLGDYFQSFSVSTDIKLVAGKINNIAINRTGTGAIQIVISSTITAWGSTTLTPSI